MNIHRFAAPALVLVLALAGCATLSEDECRTRDWYGIGFTDGLNGHPLTRLAEHQKACAEYAITIDRAQFLRGRDDGLRRYCVPDNGYLQGRAGATYHGVCEGPDAEVFRNRYLQGRHIWESERRLSEIEDQIDEVSTQLQEPKRTRDERAALVDSLRRLEQERVLLRQRIDALIEEAEAGRR